VLEESGHLYVGESAAAAAEDSECSTEEAGLVFERNEWLDRYWWMDGMDRAKLLQTAHIEYASIRHVPLPECFVIETARVPEPSCFQSSSGSGNADCKQQ
jgi:hypothetical protein